MSTSAPGRARGSEIRPAIQLTDTVDIWLRRVDSPDEVVTFAEQLDDAEAARAARFRFRRDRVRFVVRRVFLRHVLAAYTGVSPARIRYTVSRAGRPELDDRSGISFSASHADGLAIVAVARERRVGVDVERIQTVPRLLELADDVCSPGEATHLRSVDESLRDETFLRLWTRKEAYVKALGTGLSLPLTGIDVAGDTGRPRRLPGSEQPFVFCGLEGLDGYVGAVAASGTRVAIRHRGAGAMIS